ncbi:C4-dicarboxylate ABC transporter [Opitutaceae bacterium TAV4]|nr:C4-dicarboxylate ABC transporter [Opitutaceae bacterium TAV4]
MRSDIRHPSSPLPPPPPPGEPAPPTPATLDVFIRAALDASLRSGTWRIERAHIDLGAWWATLRAQAGLDATLGNWSARGRATLTGEGIFTDDGKPQGRVTLQIEDGAFFNYTDDIEIEGITLTATCEDLSGFSLADGQRLSIERIAAAGLETRDAQIELGLTADRRVRVRRAEMTALDGHLRLAPFDVALADPASLAVTATAEVEGLSLAEIAPLVPEALSEARGRLSGQLTLSWSTAAGLHVGKGGLRVEPGAPAQIRLAPRPGFFTQGVWARTKLLGFVTVENPAYSVLRNVELGRLSLQVESLDVRFMPDGEDGARTALVSITAYPADRKAVKVITFQINVAGALAKVLELGLNHSVSMGGGGGGGPQ